MSPDEYNGCLALTRTTGFEDAFTVHHADPRVKILTSWVEEAAKERGVLSCDPDVPVHLDGDLLRIRADNQTVVYRLHEQVTDPESGEAVYLAEWVD